MQCCFAEIASSRRLLLAFGFATAVCIFLTGWLRADDWPQFRGPNCRGVSTETAALPAEFSDGEHVCWSAELGDGIGSPVVADGRVFVSAMVDAQSVGLFAFDAHSGDRLWRRTWPTGELSDIHETNSHAATTPAADGERVYFYFSTLGMLAVDAATGEDAWQTDLPVPYFVFKWGAGMSPVLYRDMVLFCQDDDLSPAFYALSKQTGRILWKDDRSDMAVNYSHPVVAETPRGDEIILAGTGLLIGYDPETGERLWRARTLLRNIKTTPVCRDGVVYISLQSGGIANQWLATADRSETGNNDDRLTKAEMQAFVGDRPIPDEFFRKTFDRGDLNGDGYLQGRELDIAFLSPDNFAGAAYDANDPAQEYVLAVKAGGRGDVTDSHVLWKHPTRYTDHIVSPLVVGEQMFLVKGGGIATCFETGGGELVFGPVRINNEGQYFASPVFADGKVYVASENGYVVVLRLHEDRLEVLSRNDLGAPVLATPAISDGRLFFRTREKLICVGFCR